jgi:hypothetical protein
MFLIGAGKVTSVEGSAYSLSPTSEKEEGQ